MMNGTSGIIVPEHLAPRMPKRAQDFCTIKEAMDIAQATVINMMGPMANLLIEATERIKVLEDAAGIVAPNPNESDPKMPENAGKYPATNASNASHGDIE